MRSSTAKRCPTNSTPPRPAKRRRFVRPAPKATTIGTHETACSTAGVFPWGRDRRNAEVAIFCHLCCRSCVFLSSQSVCGERGFDRAEQLKRFLFDRVLCWQILFRFAKLPVLTCFCDTLSPRELLAEHFLLIHWHIRGYRFKAGESFQRLLCRQRRVGETSPLPSAVRLIAMLDERPECVSNSCCPETIHKRVALGQDRHSHA